MLQRRLVQLLFFLPDPLVIAFLGFNLRKQLQHPVGGFHLLRVPGRLAGLREGEILQMLLGQPDPLVVLVQLLLALGLRHQPQRLRMGRILIEHLLQLLHHQPVFTLLE